jgi:hypothetical protein
VWTTAFGVCFALRAARAGDETAADSAATQRMNASEVRLNCSLRGLRGPRDMLKIEPILYTRQRFAKHLCGKTKANRRRVTRFRRIRGKFRKETAAEAASKAE